jgi:hypothetical protein
MRIGFALLLLSACLLSGCTATIQVRLYPVKGAFAQSAAPPVFNEVNEVPYKSDTLVLANGETFTGKPRLVAASPVIANVGAGDSMTLPQPNLAFAWDLVFGQGFYVAHILGRPMDEALMESSQGNMVQEESAQHKGVAVDSKGNIYKVVW